MLLELLWIISSALWLSSIALWLLSAISCYHLLREVRRGCKLVEMMIEERGRSSLTVTEDDVVIEKGRYKLSVLDLLRIILRASLNVSSYASAAAVLTAAAVALTSIPVIYRAVLVASSSM